MSVPPFFHWYLREVPVAVTEKVAAWPSVTLWAAGWVVMAGATAVSETVSVAVLLVTVLTLLRTLTEYLAPVSALLVAGVV